MTHKLRIVSIGRNPVSKPTDKEIFEEGQRDRFKTNPYIWSSHNFETWEFGRRLPDKGFKARKGSTITTDDNRSYRLTYGKKGTVMMNEILNRNPRKRRVSIKVKRALTRKYGKFAVKRIRRNLQRTPRSPSQFIIEAMTQPRPRRFKFFYWDGSKFTSIKERAEKFNSAKFANAQCQRLSGQAMGWPASLHLEIIRVIKA